MITNDFLKFNSEIGKALIENKSEVLTSDEIQILFSENSAPEEYDLMERLFTDIFWGRRKNQSGVSRTAKRVGALVQFSF